MQKTKIGGIMFEDYVSPPSTEQEKQIIKDAKAEIEKRKEKLYNAGFRRVEFDSIAGFHFRNKRTGRFIPFTTMHIFRLMKR